MDEKKINTPPKNAIIPGPIANNSSPIRAKPSVKKRYAKDGLEIDI